MTKRRFFSGDSLEQALLEAAGHHGLEPQDVAWREVEKRHGFLRVRRNVVIEVDPEAPRRSAEGGPPATAPGEEARAEPQGQEAQASPSPPPEPSAPPPPPPRGAPARAEHAPAPPVEAPAPPAPAGKGAERPPQEASPPVTEAQVREALELLLELSDLAVDPHVEIREAVAQVDLRGPEESFLKEEEGELLKVLEQLALRMLGGFESGLEGLRIDSGSFRQKREEQLRSRALEAAREVAESGEARLLEPMDPADRRVVHLAVEEVEGVTTRSEGRGDEKRVRITREQE